MAMMTISEARAALPDVVNRVAEGEEVTITRHGRPAAVMVRPDIVWSQPLTDLVLGDDGQLVAALRERAKRHGVTLVQELDAILKASDEEGRPAERPPIQLTTVRTVGASTWTRAEFYGDEGR
jgi:antitoxin (DNA-binding transcriptional repressor) of toxin-antitoxin stability system